MRMTGMLLTMTTVLAATAALAPGAAQADEVVIGQHTIFDTRTPGMPAATEGWRTLRSVSAETDWRTGEVVLTARLGGPIPQGESVGVSWVLGRRADDGACASGKTVSVVTGEANWYDTVSASRTFGDLARDYTCLEVSLDTRGVLTDQMRDGLVDRVGSSGAEATGIWSPQAPPSPVQVLAGKPTKALLLVRSHVLPSARVTVTGTGPVAMRGLTVEGLAAGEVRPVVARLTAPSRGRFTLDLAARDERGDGGYDGSTAVRAVAAAGRPRPGTFRSADGKVTLKVDRRSRVSGLVVRGRACDLMTPRTVRLRGLVRLPRTGATAVARPAGGGWTAVQLVTRGKRRISGVLVRATPECHTVVPFEVRRA